MNKGWALGHCHRVLRVLRVEIAGVEFVLKEMARTCCLMSAATLEEI
jgi:hypothetical protein